MRTTVTIDERRPSSGDLPEYVPATPGLHTDVDLDDREQVAELLADTPLVQR